MAMDFWGSLFCIAVALLYALLYRKRNVVYRHIAVIAACVAGVLLSDSVAWFFRGSAGVLGLLKVSNFFGFLFSFLVNVPFVFYIYASADKRPGLASGIVMACVFISCVLLGITQWNGLLYYFDEANFYHRNNRWYWLITFFYLIESGAMFVILFRNRRRIVNGRFYGILVFLVLPIAAVLLQTFVYGYSLSSIAAVVVVGLCFFQLMYILQASDSQTGAASSSEVRIQTFGEFQLFIAGKPVSFRYSKTKELLAVLTDRRGAYCSNAMLVALLWEDEASSDKNAYLRKLRQDLLETLDFYGQKDLILHRRGEMALRTEGVLCDYYEFLSEKTDVSYMGEYMRQYSWAEETNAFLSQKISKI